MFGIEAFKQKVLYQHTVAVYLLGGKTLMMNLKMFLR
jgi:hypothetical protein